MAEHLHECDCAEKGHKGREMWGSVPGPWQNEPDRVDFEHAGFPCFIHRGPSGHWCGYVGVPEGHPYFENDDKYDPPISELDVHGGITYSDHCFGHICHIPRPGQPDNVRWFGFDCGHAGDRSPSEEYYAQMYPEKTFLHCQEWETYKTVDYVTAETRKLAEQLEKACAKLTED